MKKFFSLMVIAALSVTMVGCGDKKEVKKETTTTETKSVSGDKDAPAPATPK